jgi:hypothetical protein
MGGAGAGEVGAVVGEHGEAARQHVPQAEARIGGEHRLDPGRGVGAVAQVAHDGGVEGSGGLGGIGRDLEALGVASRHLRSLLARGRILPPCRGGQKAESGVAHEAMAKQWRNARHAARDRRNPNPHAAASS